ncbi:MAG TPA: hypothetical protein K8V25_04635, partial [Megamonas hypermegale]|nr:hypothetical protein [Megamonas hypermegale]
EEDSGLSDEEQERKGPKNRPKHTRKRIHQAKKNFLEKFKTASKNKSLLLLMPSKKHLSESLSEIKETAQYAGILVLSCFSALWLWIRRKRIK